MLGLFPLNWHPVSNRFKVLKLIQRVSVTSSKQNVHPKYPPTHDMHGLKNTYISAYITPYSRSLHVCSMYGFSGVYTNGKTLLYMTGSKNQLKSDCHFLATLTPTLSHYRP